MEADLLAAIGTVSRPPEIERRIAVHEAGHAVITTLLRPEVVVGVRIGSSGAFAGLVETTHDTRSTRESIHGTLLELLAGRAAEEVVLGGHSGGSGGMANSDLAMATCLSVAMETALGLGSIGPVWLGMPTPESVGPLLALRPKLAAHVQAHLEAIHAEAATLIRERLAAVSAVADALLVARSLSRRDSARRWSCERVALPRLMAVTVGAMDMFGKRRRIAVLMTAVIDSQLHPEAMRFRDLLDRFPKRAAHRHAERHARAVLPDGLYADEIRLRAG